VFELVKAEHPVSAGAPSISLTLHDGVQFSDGSPVDALAVKASLDRLTGRAPGSTPGPRQSEFQWVSSVQVVSRLELRLVFQRPEPDFRQKLTLPAAYIFKRTAGEIVGCGPYKLEGTPDAHALTLSPNPHYQRLPVDPEPGPLTGGIQFLFQPEESANRFLFLKHDMDLFRATPASVQGLSKAGARLLSRPEGAVVYIAVNTQRPDLDKSFRQAANLFINRGALITHILRGQGLPSTGPIPTVFRLGLPVAQKDTDGFDPAKGRALLRASRYAETGRAVQFLHKSDTESAWIARAVSAMLEEGGIKVERRPMDRNLLRQMNHAGDGDLFLLNWSADYPVAEDFLLPLFHSKRPGNRGNRAHYKNPELDQVLDAIASGQADKPALVQRADGIVREECPWIFLYFPVETAALSPRVQEYHWPGSYSSDRGLGIRLRPGQ
ncbi:MAG: ABC transporter substrate-binding protein, partial [Spirochaetia bacterium]|nr:ABC transporter substrate-binding protein [Spirochaetia bacterium]